MDLTRGFRDKLEKYVDLNQKITVKMFIDGKSIYDFCCFGIDTKGKLSDDRYMIFYNQPQSPNYEITYTNLGNTVEFKIDLNRLPQTINKLVFTVSIDGTGTMSNIRFHRVEIVQNNRTVAQLTMQGMDFHNEKAITSIEIYRKSVWRFAVVASGFNGGLKDLIHFYGGEIIDEITNLKPIQQKRTNQKTISHGPVILKKGQKVNLRKNKTKMGEIIVNLNWKQPEHRSFFNTLIGTKGIDLDLGCLFELKDGSKGCIQALGAHFGSLDYPPYILLDGDDRTGNSVNGETLRINGNKISQFKRVLIFTYIYEGAADWRETDGIVTIKCLGSPDVIVKMDDYDDNKIMCAIAMLENYHDETLSVEKLVEFFNGHQYLDKAFNWGLRWVRGSKD
ncbi:MAG: TerD family protein [Candidatus Onthovivens sp.]|uniref:TerD family protein n=1 Tax=Negativicutes TaxID=909932 RepID=UPI003521FC64